MKYSRLLSAVSNKISDVIVGRIFCGEIIIDLIDKTNDERVSLSHRTSVSISGFRH